ncbi:chitin deacetylase cda1 [Saccharomyces pastorianus]|uniref:chitin deacetylase n=1 Tax=Saccharomyces pastorianus TaxID=27292 RepID=A0A6C1EBX9_SACPS|nr:chitin deacetylase cda1 [Saccharomyces pastorianus]
MIIYRAVQTALLAGFFLKSGECLASNGSTALIGDEDMQTPFPEWLKEFTNITQWPGLDPPYIPLDYIDLTKVPEFERYQSGRCPNISREQCSFDCYNCVDVDDVTSCFKLSQTFDDGPTPATETLLENLRHRTTFFVLGINTVSFPHIYESVVERGHLVGTHTWSHAFLPSLSNEEIVAQIEWSIWAMNATGKHFPKYFRPPYGAIDNRVRAIVKQFGLTVVLWDHDTFDWKLITNDKLRTEEQIFKDIETWKSQRKGLILEHDGARRTVDLAIKINKLVGNDQLTVAECIGDTDYIERYD